MTDATRLVLMGTLMVWPWTFFLNPPLFVGALMAPPLGGQPRPARGVEDAGRAASPVANAIAAAQPMPEGSAGNVIRLQDARSARAAPEDALQKDGAA